jgi:hypothetical protein
MQAEINGLMMAKKNSAVLWTVDQHTNDSDVKAGRKTAQKNIGITKDTAHNPPTGKLIDYEVDHKFIKKVTLDSDNDLTAEFGRPTLDDMTYVQVAGMNMSIGTHPNDGTSNAGKIETQDLTLDPNTDVTTDGNGTTYVSSVAQASNGKVTYKTQTITEATDEEGGSKQGITSLCSETVNLNHAFSNNTTTAVTPKGLKDALTFSEKNYSLGTNSSTGIIETHDLTLDESDRHLDRNPTTGTSLTSDAMVFKIYQESNGKVSYDIRNVAINGNAVTVTDGSSTPEQNKSVRTNNNGTLIAEDLTVADVPVGNPSHTFVSSVTSGPTGKISVTKGSIGAALDDTIGGIKIGYQTSAENRNYAVQLDHEQAYVNVPWENTHYTSKNVICKTASGTDDTAVSTSDVAYLNHVENGSVTDFHKIVGNGITVAYNKDDKKLTLTSNSGTVTSITAGTGLTTNPATGITGTGSISLNAAGDNALGGIKLGYTDSTVGTKNYAVNVDTNGKAYVNVPWTGTVTSITAGNGLTTNPAAGITGTGSISLNTAGNDALGGIKLGYTESKADRQYPVKLGSSGNNVGKAYVEVPLASVYNATAANMYPGLVTSAAPPADTSMANRYYNVEIADNQGHMKVYVPWVDNIYYVPYGEDNYSDALAAFNAHKLVYTIIPTSVTHSSDVTAVAATVAGSMMHFRSTVSTGQLSTTYFAYEKSDGTWSYTTDSVAGIPPGETGYSGRVLTLDANLNAGWELVNALPSHGSTDGNKILALSSDGSTPQWRNGLVPIYTDFTSSDRVVGWKIATTKVRTSSNHDSSSVSAWVTIRARDATSNLRNQGTLFAGYMWINYRGNDTDTPTISTVFNSLTNYTNGWKLYRHQYTDSNRYVSDWYVCLPSTVQWIEITMHVLGTVGDITLCTERVSSIGSGWTVAIEASKTPYMIGAGGVGSNTSPVYIATDGKVTQCSTVDADTVDGLHFVLGSWSSDQNTISLL